MRLDGDALDALDALENLLNAESADVVNDVLDDACKAWCDGAREGEEKRTQRLRKNCEKIKEKLEVESDDEALRTTRACETVVRMSVWALGASGGENASMGFERAVTHEKLRALLVERALVIFSRHFPLRSSARDAGGGVKRFRLVRARDDGRRGRGDGIDLGRERADVSLRASVAARRRFGGGGGARRALQRRNRCVGRHRGQVRGGAQGDRDLGAGRDARVVAFVASVYTV